MKGKRWEAMVHQAVNSMLTESLSNTGSLFYPPSFTETSAPEGKVSLFTGQTLFRTAAP